MKKNYKVNFTKNFGHNQMCIEPILTEDSENISSNYTNDYRIKMICNNSIKGLLNTHIQYINGIPNFCYEISGMQSLSITLENKPLNHTLLSRIIYEIYNLLFTCEKYMLDTDNLLLDPDYIFISPNTLAINLCYLPMKTNNFTTSMRELFDYLLKHIDHKDEKCVYIAYSIHNHCVSNNFTPDILTSYINIDEYNTSSQDVTALEQKKYVFDYSSNSTDNSACNNSSVNNNYISKDDNRNLTTDVLHENTRPTPDDNLQSPKTSATLPNETVIKLGLLIVGFIIGLISIFTLHYFNKIDFPLLIISILALICISVLIGYNLFKNIEGQIYAMAPNNNNNNNNNNNKINNNNYNNSNNNSYYINYDYSNLQKSSNYYIEDSGSTILLSSVENNDSHMLISTNTDTNTQVILSHYPFTIGKDSNCDLVIQNPIISRLHCRINCYLSDDNSTIYYLEDLNSTNGTYHNNVALTPYKKSPLKSGDNISFGHLTYIFR